MRLGRRCFTLGLGAALGSCSTAPRAGLDISPTDKARTSDGAAEQVWAEGYSQAELDDAQAKYELVFPPDLVALLRERRPAQGYDWRSDDEQIRKMLKWPLEGLLFDVENNELWWSEWGPRPTTSGARSEVLAKIVGRAPKLIPLLSHRYLPAEPNEPGNPVFSIYQSDVIYYGFDLADYFKREFGDPTRPVAQQVKRIPFWSELVERGG